MTYSHFNKMRYLFLALFIFWGQAVRAQEVMYKIDSNAPAQINEEVRKIRNAPKVKYIYFVIPEETLVTGTDKVGRIYVDFNGRIKEVSASVNTAPTGSSIICDLNKNNSTIWETQARRVSILVNTYTGNQTCVDTPDFIRGDYFTLDLDQIGSSVAGSKLVIRMQVSQK